MRAARIFLVSLALFASTVTAGSAIANEGQAKRLLLIEQRGLETISKATLEGMVSTIESKKGFQMSRAWLDAQPVAKGNSEWKCLAEALYFEARGESLKGQFAVAEVIMNRVAHSRFPSTICGVVNQGTGRKYQCQFTYTCDGHAEHINEPKAYRRVGKVARAVMDGKAPDLTHGATHYHTTAVKPSWSRVYTRTARIGVHIFYRHNVRSASK